jgi:hypothetical protein
MAVICLLVFVTLSMAGCQASGQDTAVPAPSPEAENGLTTMAPDDDLPSDDLAHTQTSLPTTVPVATETAPPTTETSFVYDIVSVAPTEYLGASDIYVFHVEGEVRQTPVTATELRLPNDEIRAMTDNNRFEDPRGPYKFSHMGSDYASLTNGPTPVVPPTDNAILVATAYVERASYTATAIDMSSNLQMYLVTVAEAGGPREYLICYTHLSPESNERARAQALTDDGRVKAVGTIGLVHNSDAIYSDIHIAVIDVERLQLKTGEQDLEAALHALFVEQLPRTNQRYVDIFVRPENVIVALEEILAESQTEPDSP